MFLKPTHCVSSADRNSRFDVLKGYSLLSIKSKTWYHLIISTFATDTDPLVKELNFKQHYMEITHAIEVLF